MNKLCESFQNTVEVLASKEGNAKHSRENILPLSKYVNNEAIQHLTKSFNLLNQIAKDMLDIFPVEEFKKKLESCNDKESFQKLLDMVNSYDLPSSLKEELAKLNQNNEKTKFEQLKPLAKDLVSRYIKASVNQTGRENKEG